MDQRGQDQLIARCARQRPDDAVLGEEEGGATGTSGITWVVDPIDGTVNYLYGIPAYAVSVAAVVGDPTTPGAWRPCAGAVLQPRRRRAVLPPVAGGAGSRVVVGGRERPGPDGVHRPRPGPGGHRLRLRRGPPRARRRRLLLDVLPRVRDIRRHGSAALDLCGVAAGRLDAYYETGLNPWDLAAGWLVATEAGVRRRWPVRRATRRSRCTRAVRRVRRLDARAVGPTSSDAWHCSDHAERAGVSNARCGTLRRRWCTIAARTVHKHRRAVR